MINYLSLFSGIGAFEKALRNIGIEYNLIGYSEIDKSASKSYSAIHEVSEEKNYGDITQIDEKKLPKDIDLLTYGFPCVDISIAGEKKGFIDEKGEKTRSGLFYDALRIIKYTKPKVCICENVKNLTSPMFKEIFEKVVLKSLSDVGYKNYWKVLNSKDYGIPQNRERVFIVSIRKDIEQLFVFPEKQVLKKHIIDLLDKEVDEKLYLNNEKSRKVEEQIKRRKINTNIEDTIKLLGNIYYNEETERNENRYGEQSNCSSGRVVEIHGIIPAIGASHFMQTKYIYDNDRQKIRILSPRESFRFFGFSDEDFDKASRVIIAKSHLYKQAGNSIVVNVLEEIFRNLYINKPKTLIDFI